VKGTISRFSLSTVLESQHRIGTPPQTVHRSATWNKQTGLPVRIHGAPAHVRLNPAHKRGDVVATGAPSPHSIHKIKHLKHSILTHLLPDYNPYLLRAGTRSTFYYLTFTSSEVTRHLCVLPTQRTYVFCMDLKINSDYSPTHNILSFYNRDGMCFLRGTCWTFKYNSCWCTYIAETATKST
jgi:hypothetical protein